MANPTLTDPFVSGSPGNIRLGTADDQWAEIWALAIFINGAEVATLADPTFTGTVTVPTLAGGDTSTSAANAAWVAGEIATALSGLVSTEAALTAGNVVIGAGDEGVEDGGVALADLATLASPDFSGTPTAPTAAPGTETTQIATTEFVADAIATAALGHTAGTDTALNTGGDNEVTAAELRAHLDDWLNDGTVSGVATWSSSKISDFVGVKIAAELLAAGIPDVISAVLSDGLPAEDPTLKVLIGTGAWWEHDFLSVSALPEKILAANLPHLATKYFSGDGTWEDLPDSSHDPNTDTALDLGGDNAVTAAAIVAFMTTPPTQGVAEAGTSTDVYAWSPERVKQAIEALVPEGTVLTLIDQVTAEAGTDEVAHSWSALRVAQAIAALAPSLLTQDVHVVLTGEDEAITTGTGLARFRVSRDWTLEEIIVDCATGPVGLADVFEIKYDGTTILSAPVSVAVGQTTATATIATDELDEDGFVTIDCTQKGSTSAGIGYKILFRGHPRLPTE